MYLRIILSISIYLFSSVNCCLAGCGGFKESIGVYCEDVQELHNKGMIEGYEDGEFKFFRLLSRRELTKIVVLAKAKIYNIPKSEIEKYEKNKCFSDVETEDWGCKYICYANDEKNNIVDGCNEKENKFCPDDTITYDEASKIILRALSGGANCWENKNGAWYIYYVDYMNNILDANKSHSEEVSRALFAHMLNTAMKPEHKDAIESCLGLNLYLDDDELLEKYAPVMSFHAGDYLPSGIEVFINHAVLYEDTWGDDEEIAYGDDLPNTIGKWEWSSYNLFDISSKKMSLVDFPSKLYVYNTDTLYLDILNESFWDPSGKDTNNGFGDSQMKEVFYRTYKLMEDNEKIIYGRVVSQGDKKYLQYHFFYLINEWNGNGGNIIGYHEGDWEGMMIEINSKQEPLRVTASSHKAVLGYKGGETKEWGAINKSGTHPIVFIGKGGHPTYFNNGVTPVAFGLTGTDDHSGTDVILRNNDSVNVDSINNSADKITYRIINIDNDIYTNNWITSKVVWGHDYEDKTECSVQAPKFFDPDRWDNPKKWMDARE